MDATPSIGHNNPPDPLLIEASERIDTANKWLTERATITDMVTADKANFFVSQIGATFTALDNQRKDENRNWLAQQDVKYKTPLTLLGMAKDKLTALRRDFLIREERRLAEERAKVEAEARRKAEEAAAALAKAEAEAKRQGGDALRAELAAREAVEAAADAVAAVEAAPTRATISGTYSTRATGLRTIWTARILNLGDALRSYGKDQFVVNAIEEAILRAAKRDSVAAKDPARAPKGVEFFSEKV